MASGWRRRNGRSLTEPALLTLPSPPSPRRPRCQAFTSFSQRLSPAREPQASSGDRARDRTDSPGAVTVSPPPRRDQAAAVGAARSRGAADAGIFAPVERRLMSHWTLVGAGAALVLAAGCVVAAVGAGAGGGIYLTERGVESVVPVSVERAAGSAKRAFADLKLRQ